MVKYFKNPRCRCATVVVLIAIVSVFSYLYLCLDKIVIANVSWEISDASIFVKFDIKNKTKKPITSNLKIRLYQKSFAAGSPKAEMFDLAGQEKILVSLDPKENREIKKAVNIDRPPMSVEMVTVSVWEKSKAHL